MVKFTGAQAKSSDTLGPSALHRLLKLSLSVFIVIPFNFTFFFPSHLILFNIEIQPHPPYH